MDAFKIAIKLFAEQNTFGPAEFVPIFHRWIQNQVLPNHLLIDVADYEHVHAGPGTVLIAHEANLAMDHGDDRLGLLYVRKQPIANAATVGERLHAVVFETLQAALLLEQEPELIGRLRFGAGEISIRFDDRLLTPNNLETFAKVKPAIDTLAADLFGDAPIRVRQEHPNSQRLLEAIILADTPAKTVKALLHRFSDDDGGVVHRNVVTPSRMA